MNIANIFFKKTLKFLLQIKILLQDYILNAMEKSGLHCIIFFAMLNRSNYHYRVKAAHGFVDGFEQGKILIVP